MRVERGSRLGSYELRQWIALDSEAQLWSAVDVTSGQRVAVKIVATTSSSAAQFLHEIETLSAVQHPNIVQIQDTGTLDDGCAWYAMFRYAGTLGDYLKRHGRLLPRESAKLLAPIADALSALHRHFVVHRDVTPSNILLSESGQAVLADFGVVAREGGESRTFLAPEILGGDPAHPGSDAYSFGVIAFLSVMGVLPGTDPRAEMTRAGINPQFASIVARLLDPDPSVRLDDMSVAAAALEAVASPRRRTAPSRPVELVDYPHKFGAYAIALACVFVVCGLVAAASVIANG